MSLERAVCRFAVCLLCLVGLASAAPAGERADVTAVGATGGSPISEVLSFAPDTWAEHDRVRVTGVVTMWQPKKFVGVVQDSSAAIWVACWDPALKKRVSGVIRPGMRVTVTGRLHRGGYSPLLVAGGFEFEQIVDLPEPQPADLERLFAGADNGVRTSCVGIVQSFRQAADGRADLVLACGGRPVQAQVLDAGQLPPGHGLIDGRVRITGVVGAIRNTRGEFLAPRLIANDAADVAIIDPPPTDTAALPPLKLADIGRYVFEPLVSRRVITEGIVTYADPGEIFIQEGLCGVRLVPANPDGIAQVTLGDRVRVRGFLDRSSGIAGIREASVEKLAAGSPPEPVPIRPGEIVRINADAISKHLVAEPSDYHGCLIEFPATVVETLPPVGDAAGALVLSTNGTTAVARFVDPAFAALSSLRPGTTVRIRGVVQLQVLNQDQLPGETAPPFSRQVTLRLRSPADVVVLAMPSWWTPGRLGLLLAGVATVLAAALGWAWMLRRELQSQAMLLAREIRLRRDAAIDYEASLRERNRLAANLHDTLLQTLGGIEYQLGACRVTAESGRELTASHIEVAGRMVEHATKELRGSVWALRTMPLVGHSFTDSIQTLLNQVSLGRKEQIRLETRGIPFPLPNFVAGNLLLVVQEAVLNSLNHASGSETTVSIDYDEEQSLIEVAVRDDGHGFTMGTQMGPEQGHFGLQGMRERVDRLGGWLEISSLPGHGTSVRVRVHTRDYDPVLEGEA